jgi:glyoxylase-like metal-dependent hydrolase (beta-lactamase superfamily II)
VERVLPGFYKITLPIPIQSLKSVFVYLILGENNENLLIDTGWNTEESLDSLRTAFSGIGFDARDLKKIVVSHLHPDHFGLSSTLKKEANDSELMMHKDDAAGLRKSPEDYERFIRELQDWIAMHGTPPEELEAMMKSTAPMAKYINPAKPDTLLSGGERIKVGAEWEFEVISTPGHTRGNICLYERAGSRVLFSGDHVLPTITPNVSLGPLYEGDPLGDYLKSLDSLKKLDVSSVLPSHEFIFQNLPSRLSEIESHHQERLRETLAAFSGISSKKMTAYEVASKLHWYAGSWEKLSPWEKRAAIMETLAHLEYLKRGGRIREVVEESESGKRRFFYSIIVK